MKPTTEMKRVAAASRRKVELRKQVRELRKLLKETEERLLQKEQLLRDADDVTHVIDGLPLSISGAAISEVTDTITRFTQSYENVRDGGTGLRFRQWGEGAVDVAIITSTTPSKARAFALAWVLKGELPKVPELIDHRPTSRRR